MKFELEGHRCFKIPREKLDLFLIALDVNFSVEHVRHKMEYVFMAEETRFYDVVVGRYGSYPYVENQLEKFVSELRGPK